MTVTWKNCLKIGVSIFILYLCIFYWEAISGFISVALSAATPIFIGFSIAYVLNILMGFYEKHYFKKQNGKKFVEKSRKPVCLIGAILTLCGIIALVVGLVVPELVSCVKFLISEIPPLIESILESKLMHDLLPAETVSQLASIDWMSHISNILQTVSSGLGNAVNIVVTALTSAVSVVITVFLSIIFSIYLLNGKDVLISQAKRVMKNYLPKKTLRKTSYFLTVLNDSFHHYIVGQCTEAVILGLLCMIGMLIFRFPYAGMIGALIGFTALIPVAGAYIGASVGALMILTESPIKALLFLVFIVVLQQLEGNLIYPKVVGKSIGLPAIWVLAAVTVGGGLMGVLGMLLGVPIVAALYRVLREDMNKREQISSKEN